MNPFLFFIIKIAAFVEESFKLKKQSEQLLDLAKQAVEVAIEEGEEKALEMISANTKDSKK